MGMSTLVTLFSLGLLLAVLATLLVFIYTNVRGAPYVRTKPARLQTMLELAQITPGTKAVDLGSGNGIVVIALARAGSEAHGYEVNPVLVWLARRAIRREGLTDRAFIHLGSMWRADLRSFELVTVYGMPHLMAELGQKLTHELKPGSVVVSNAFQFPGWSAEAERNSVRRYLV